jgi:vacuolar protein sorting-associated protein 3
VVDTVLVELLAASADPEDAGDLKSLLDESTHLVLEDVESTLVQRSQFNALARVYEKNGNHAKLLELLVK